LNLPPPGLSFEKLALDAGGSVNGILGMLSGLNAPCRATIRSSSVPGYKKVAATGAVGPFHTTLLFEKTSSDRGFPPNQSYGNFYASLARGEK
jgi:hypothetical protein